MKEIKRGEIYSGDFGAGFGSEQGGVRPVLILQNNTGNKYSPTTIVAAITSRKTKTALPTHVAIMTSGLKTEAPHQCGWPHGQRCYGFAAGDV